MGKNQINVEQELNLVDAEEEHLTLNIYELLSCDLQMYMLTFLSIPDLYSVALSNSHGAFLVLSSEADEYVWKSMAGHLGIHMAVDNNGQMLIRDVSLPTDESLVEDSNCPPSDTTKWRTLVYSNMIKWDPETRTPDSTLHMHNNNKTISCERPSGWQTIRATKILKMGMVHCWEYVLEDHDNGDYNLYRMFVGIEKSTYAFTEEGANKIIGYSSEGIGYNIGEHSIHREKTTHTGEKSILHKKQFNFSTGDTIAIKLDLLSETAAMHLFKNNEYFHTISDIPTQGIEYYPAISIIGRHRVHIRTKHSSNLKVATTRIDQESV